MKTVLIVDDKRVQLKTLRRGLITRGYRIFEALSGREALEHLVRDPACD
jgi:CheY-like chemotaxis protein